MKQRAMMVSDDELRRTRSMTPTIELEKPTRFFSRATSSDGSTSRSAVLLERSNLSNHHGSSPQKHHDHQQHELQDHDSVCTTPTTSSSSLSLSSSSKSSPPPQRLVSSSKSNTKKTKKKKKQVRFGNVHEFTYWQRSPTKSERKSLWYSAKEIRAFRTEICALNLTAASSSSPGNNKAPLLVVKAFEEEEEAGNNTWRGLEHVKRGALMQKLEHRTNFVQTFLYFSHELGVSDPMALAVFAASNSKADRQRAVQMGTQDALDASKIYYAFFALEEHSKEAQAARRECHIQNLPTPAYSTGDITTSGGGNKNNAASKTTTATTSSSATKTWRRFGKGLRQEEKRSLRNQVRIVTHPLL